MMINDDYRIIAVDKLNVQIQKKTTVKDEKSENYGKEIWVTQAYCSSWESALETLVRWEVNGTGLTDLETVIDKMNEIKELISNLKFEE